MVQTRNWTVDVAIDENEEDRRTHAVAVLHSGVRSPVRGEGTAHRAPCDREVPEVGDELATARALSDLAYQLLDMTAADIEAITHRPAHLIS
ncbi:hypothetical protein GCM10010112_64220 [Actinoplanes lobatus]|uniref:DUF1876 domain-containing protein n=1 Tax=Actinoplanes lobatus TaxID=113568 RepID=A0A7W7MKY6_9ACTN|nr:DUF1876 domain-containing protein [Actinoplanes lobatus]MBB4753585.1 hypothetical protein [Actinoplanes lobatus]GGN84685.1 hypothetical protein GCM10010112_64220 [Actinoplanes lobatus]GIE38122.1 hypothetical protein Alo02nite_10200 [Actinoplanes lobatus]